MMRDWSFFSKWPVLTHYNHRLFCGAFLIISILIVWVSLEDLFLNTNLFCLWMACIWAASLNCMCFLVSLSFSHSPFLCLVKPVQVRYEASKVWKVSIRMQQCDTDGSSFPSLLLFLAF